MDILSNVQNDHGIIYPILDSIFMEMKSILEIDDSLEIKHNIKHFPSNRQYVEYEYYKDEKLVAVKRGNSLCEGDNIITLTEFGKVYLSMLFYKAFSRACEISFS